jgi:hypothetical protein
VDAIKQTRFLLALSVETDGNRLRIFGSVPGFFLAGDDHDAVWRDLGPALQAMLRRNHGFPDLGNPQIK